MHGLCNRALQCFLRDSFGDAAWRAIARSAGLPGGLAETGFEALRPYDDALTDALLSAAAQVTRHEPEALLEDLGTYLVSHPSSAAIRRLLRFGGADFVAFLLALEDLPDRVRLAVADLDLPRLTVRSGGGVWHLSVGAGLSGFAAVIAGLIRAMADDYGTLVVLTREANAITLRLVESDFAEGRGFALAG
ncbi:heme NO-binding domain-containing protein [Paragemmobacter straminiformis]|uniref:Heme NO-binding domain-containing protein n=1 Tax=Paragemmobacter straminiformis TaxID=2045119 RepID=A0A842I1V0_9RHOB|nr:heme NO-binding domain-containing protein [Gemmobacter straminiformis]MBC2834322.1 heme NO-binding domain-containing protein [Gemmobacter straminiformis]